MKQSIHTAINNLSRDQATDIIENQLGAAAYDDEPMSDLTEMIREHMEADCYPEIYLPE